MIIAPCRECKDRVAGCHDACPRYKEFQRACAKRKESDRKFYSRYGDIVYRIGRDLKIWGH